MSACVAHGAGAEPEWLPSPEAWSDQRALYLRAAAELDSGAGSRYQELRTGLTDYPLSLDLDFSVKLGQLHHMTAEQARGFLNAARGTPLAARFLVAYLRHKGQDRRWRQFLDALDTAPNMPELQCYYYRAKLATGERAEAFSGAAMLWNVGFSQEDACDPLFGEWMKAGGPEDPLIWARALKAFEAKNGYLIRYVKRFASPELQRDLDELASVYRRPSRVEGDHHPYTERHADILMMGIVRLAQLNPSRAYEAMISVKNDLAAAEGRWRKIRLAIVRHSLFAERAPAPPDWVDTQIQSLNDDELTIIWLRNAIAEGRWRDILSGVSWLGKQNQSTDRWRYWEARSRDELGLAGGDSLWTSLAQSRSFHGFLAADRVGSAYTLNEMSPQGEIPPLGKPTRLGVQRAQELLALGDSREAKEQWRHTLNQLPRDRRSALGDIALSRGWSDLATDSANAASDWDRLDLRFPVRYWPTFQRVAEEMDQEPYSLLAIARRESGLFALARSKVGARGLMQVMPATARSVAKARGETYRGASSLYQPEVNITLGSTYYAQLMTRYEGNRIKALAAYNAGPSRVARWSDGAMSVDQWVDAIPFSETREYVQAVLAYDVIYRIRSGKSATILREEEAAVQY